MTTTTIYLWARIRSSSSRSVRRGEMKEGVYHHADTRKFSHHAITFVYTYVMLCTLRGVYILYRICRNIHVVIIHIYIRYEVYEYIPVLPSIIYTSYYLVRPGTFTILAYEYLDIYYYRPLVCEIGVSTPKIKNKNKEKHLYIISLSIIYFLLWYIHLLQLFPIIPYSY